MGPFISSFFALFQWQNAMMMLLGTLIGVVVGVLPGIGSMHTVALMIPLTWKMDVIPAMILLFSISATSRFGGSLTAILFNIPGDNVNASTLIDGFPMAKQGKARTAIGASATSSIFGGLFSSLSLLIFMPVMFQLILIFGPAEVFMLALFGLTAISAVSGKSIVKGLIGGGIGILIATIGYHPLGGKPRFTFGIQYLLDGINMVPIMLGVLAIVEAMRELMEGSSIVEESVALSGRYRDGIVAAFRNTSLIVRSCLIAWVVGIAPGAGATTSGFLSYASATKTCKNPETFGKGDVRGLIAADTAISACHGGDILPTITMGIPGSGGMAVMLGAFLVHGISPGPQLIKIRPDLVYIIILTIFFAHVISVFMAVGFSRGMEYLTKVRAEIVCPIIIVFCFIGSYIMRQYWQDMLVATILGIVGYYMRKYGYHPVPLVLGVILGPVAEISFFQALYASDNGILIFFTRIPSLIIFLCIITVVFWPFIRRMARGLRRAAVPS